MIRLHFWLVTVLLVGCGSAALEPAAVDLVSQTSPNSAEITAPASPTSTSTATATATQTATPAPTATATATLVPTRPSATPTAALPPTATPIPTPPGLPPAPNGWRWELHATAVPVTHYITTEVYPDLNDPEQEHAYGPNDQPIPSLPPLPRTFLLETAYQGSGKLPNGDLLEHVETRAPVEAGLVPFRFVVTPHDKCGGFPIAGNSTCSVPFETAATTWQEDGPLVPVGSRIYIVELGMKVIINDVALAEGIPHKIDLYTGYVNNYDYERPDGSDIWVLVSAESTPSPVPPPEPTPTSQALNASQPE